MKNPKNQVKKVLKGFTIIIMFFFSLFIPDLAFADTCSSGGPGSTSCSVSVTVEGVGKVTYSVTCGAGYYACCNGLTGAWCVKTGGDTRPGDCDPGLPCPS